MKTYFLGSIKIVVKFLKVKMCLVDEILDEKWRRNKRKTKIYTNIIKSTKNQKIKYNIIIELLGKAKVACDLLTSELVAF